jgi:hypothetical protein
VDSQLLGAARNNSEERVTGLINRHGAQPWCADGDGMTPLHHACASDHDNIAILKTLIDEYADVDAVNKAGESPLRLAINQKGPQSAKAKYIRTRGGKDIGPRAVQASRSGPPAPEPPAPPALQNYNPPNHNIARDLKISPEQDFSFFKSTPTRFDDDMQRLEELNHYAKLASIAARVNFLDQYRPPEFGYLSPSEQSEVENIAAKSREKVRDLQLWDNVYS